MMEIPSVPVRIRHRLLLVGPHGAQQARVALLLLGRARELVHSASVRPASTGMRSATVVPQGWGEQRLEVTEAPPLEWLGGRCNTDLHAYEMVLAMLNEYAATSTVVFCVHGNDTTHGVRPNRFINQLQENIGQHVRGIIVVTGTSLAVDTLFDVVCGPGARPVVMQALDKSPGVILQVAGL